MSDDCGETGFATVTFTATDACGNSSSTTATFAIEDTTAPAIDAAAADATVECDGAGNGGDLTAWLESNGGATASDACSGVDLDAMTSTALSDDCGATGAATVTFTATDDLRQQQQHDSHVHDRRLGFTECHGSSRCNG